MKKTIFYINRSEELEPDNELKEKIEYSDNETLLKIISALMDSNEALRKYISILEKSQY